MSDKLRIRELKLMPYEEYLETVEWAEKKAQALDRAKYRCQVCNSPNDLQVHHRTYENRGDERPEDLTVLCGSCHGLYHSNEFTSRPVALVKDVVEGLYTRIEYTYQYQEPVGIFTGLADLDRLLGGLQRSDLIVIAGRPGMGKTTLGIGFLMTACLMFGKSCLFFSLEMSGEQLTQRMVSAYSRVPFVNITQGKVKVDEWPRIHEALKVIGDASIGIDDTPALTVKQIRDKAVRYSHDNKLDLIIVDYLQLIGTDKHNQSVPFQVAGITKALKHLARELDIPVVLMSQLGNSTERKQDKRPEISDLNALSAIQADADVIIFLYREDFYNIDTEHPNLVEVIVAKHRNGPTGVFTVFFRKELMQFISLEIKKSPLE